MADLSPPTVQWSDDIAGTLNRSTPTINYTLNFSEPVTGLETSDFVVNKGQVVEVSGSASSWKVSVAIYDATAGQMEITLKAGAVLDEAGNTNAASSDTRQAIDTLTPAAPTLSARGITATLLDPRVRLDTSLGSFTLELDPDLAPFSANNLLNYAASGFYAGTIIHRIVNDTQPSGMQIVQGGGLTADMVQKATGSAIPLESANGLSNLRGTVAMARTNVANSGTSQFYINVDDNLFLDYQSQLNPGYAVFGRVVDGMTVIDTMLGKPVNASSVPLTPITVSRAEIIQKPSPVYSRTGMLDVAKLESGASLYYSLDGGKSSAAALTNFLQVPEGTYPASSIRLLQEDAAGNRSNVGMYGRDLVVDKTAPQLKSSSPLAEALYVQPGQDIVLEFTEPVLRGTGLIELKTAAGLSVGRYTSGSGELSISGSKLTVNPASDLSYGGRYILTLASDAVQDLAGNSYAGLANYGFTITSAQQTVTGTPGADTLIGGSGNDTVSGLAGDDFLQGGAGSDSLQGGDGADILIGHLEYDDSQLDDPAFKALLDQEKANALDTLAGGAGDDFYLLDQYANTPLIIENPGEGTDAVLGGLPSYTLGDHLETYVNDGSYTVNGVQQPVIITGNGLNNLIKTSPASWESMQDILGTISSTASKKEVFRGLGGNDTLLAGLGDDTLEGGDGDDSIDGGGGQDTAVYALAASQYTVTATASGYRVVARSGSEGTDQLSLVESLQFADRSGPVADFLTAPSGEGLVRFWNKPSLSPSEINQAQAVNLTDAIAILKMIVGLPVNADQKPLSPYQSLAADFDGDGQVGLGDAIGVLKMVVGLSAPTPTWQYYDPSKIDSSLSSQQALNPASWANGARMDKSAAATVELVGVLTGDVDGSWGV